MYTEKIHRIVNAKCKNAGKRQSMLKKCSESSMQGERMIGNYNVRIKNAQDRQYTQREHYESSMHARSILGIVNARRENARNPQCAQKNAWNPQKDRKYGRNYQYTQID